MTGATADRRVGQRRVGLARGASVSPRLLTRPADAGVALTGSRRAPFAGRRDVGPLHGIPTDVLGTSPSSDVDEDRHGRR